MTTCRSCPAEVVFVQSAKSGKPMILDAKPTKGVIITVHDSAGPLTPKQAEHHAGCQVAQVVDVYTDHHSTCPEAAAWKGKRR